MTAILDFLGSIVLVVGVSVWVLMLQSGLASREPQPTPAEESPGDEPTE
jgi:hypothetical protein